MNTANAARELPGSRGKGNARDERGKGKGERGKCESNQWGDPERGTDNHQRQEGDDEYQDDWGDQTQDVLFARNENGPPSDLDWGNFGNYGAEGEVGNYLQNNEETQGYEEMQNQKDVEVFRVSPKAQILRDRKGGFRDPLNNPREKSAG